MNCVVCDKIREKKALIVYEDDNLIAVLPSKPAVPGHIKIMPKQHFTQLDEMSDELVEDLFFLANFASSVVFDTLKAHGTNIILNEADAHLAFDVIPRKEDDGLSFMWKPKQLSSGEMDDILNKIKDKAFLVGRKEERIEGKAEDKKEEPQPIPAISKEEKDKEPGKESFKEKVNYLIKHLTKIP